MISLLDMLKMWLYPEECLAHKKYYWMFEWGACSKSQDLGLSSPGKEHGNPLKYSCLENPWHEPGGLQSMGLLQLWGIERIFHNEQTKAHRVWATCAMFPSESVLTSRINITPVSVSFKLCKFRFYKHGILINALMLKPWRHNFW